MSVENLLTPIPPQKRWAKLYVDSINVGSGGITGGPFHITETVSTGPSTITGDVGSFNGQLQFTTTNNTANYSLVGPSVYEFTNTTGVKLYAQNGPLPISGLAVDGNSAIRTFQSGTFIALLPNGTSAFVASQTGVVMPIQPYLETSLPSSLSIPGGIDTPLTTMTNVRTVGTITYNSGTGVYTVPISGVYTISYSVNWQTTIPPSSSTGGFIQITGDSGLYGNSLKAIATTTGSGNTGSLVKYLVGGTQLTIQVNQISGGSLNIIDGHVSIYQNS